MKKEKMIAVGLGMVMAMTSLSGCGIKTDTPIIGNIVGLKSDQIFKVDKLICTMPEYKLLLMNEENQYRSTFGSDVDWNTKIKDNITFKVYLLEKVKNDISLKYTLAAMAANKSVTLTADEKTKVSSAADNYYNSLTDEEKKYTEAKKADVESVYTNYLLADKVYTNLTANIGNDVSDEESRVTKIQYIRMNTDKTAENKIKSTLNQVIKIVKAGYQPFSREAKQYSQDDIVEVTIKKNVATARYQTEAFNLNNGQMSSIIQDGNNYYLVYCVESYMKDQTAANKADIISKAKEEYFAKEYESYKKSLKNDFNTKTWEDTEFTNDENIKSTSLLTTFETITK